MESDVGWGYTHPTYGYGTSVLETLSSEQVHLMKKLCRKTLPLVSRDLLSGFASSTEAVEQNRAGGGRHEWAARLGGSCLAAGC